MPLSSALLRICLCLSLVLNGSGAVAAATRMQLEHAAASDQLAVAPPQQTAQAVGAPCHEHAGMTMAAQAPTPATQMTPPMEPSKHPAPDCCKSSKCFCACVQPAQAIVVAFRILGPHLVQTALVHALTTAHAEPALPHLIRPPIS